MSFWIKVNLFMYTVRHSKFPIVTPVNSTTDGEFWIAYRVHLLTLFQSQIGCVYDRNLLKDPLLYEWCKQDKGIFKCNQISTCRNCMELCEIQNINRSTNVVKKPQQNVQKDSSKRGKSKEKEQKRENCLKIDKINSSFTLL